MNERSYSIADYKYGFNGKEMDKDVSGNGNQYDYGFRIYNPRLGKFLSVDPLSKNYPWYTPYQFAGNMPISAVDLDGLEIYFAADGSYIGKWSTSTNVRVLKNEDVPEFRQDMQAAHSDPNNLTNKAIMDLYWSGAAGSHNPSTSEKSTISIDHVISPSSHESYSVHGDCYQSATATLSNNGYSAGSYWSPDNQYEFQMFTATNSPNVDIQQTRLSGFEEINTQLEAGKPLLVGVDYRSGSSNPDTDGTTDHFLLLTGRGFDDEGNLYYTGFENVDSGNTDNGTSTELNRFYPQSDGTLQGGTTYRSGMTITQVRPVD